MVARGTPAAGQAILELTLSSGVITLAIFGSGWLLRASWDRLQCARLTFERAHAALLAEPGVRYSKQAPGHPLQIWEKPDQVVAFSQCGSTREHLAFEKLESIQKRRNHAF